MRTRWKREARRVTAIHRWHTAGMRVSVRGWVFGEVSLTGQKKRYVVHSTISYGIRDFGPLWRSIRVPLSSEPNLELGVTFHYYWQAPSSDRPSNCAAYFSKRASDAPISVALALFEQQ